MYVYVSSMLMSLQNYMPHNNFRKAMNILYDPFKAVCFYWTAEKKRELKSSWVDINRFYIAPHMQRNSSIYGYLLCTVHTNTCVHPLIVYQNNKKKFYRVSLCRPPLSVQLYIVSCFIHNTQSHTKWNA